jgi:hypothetical protein
MLGTPPIYEARSGQLRHRMDRARASISLLPKRIDAPVIAPLSTWSTSGHARVTSIRDSFHAIDLKWQFATGIRFPKLRVAGSNPGSRALLGMGFKT